MYGSGWNRSISFSPHVFWIDCKYPIVAFGLILCCLLCFLTVSCPWLEFSQVQGGEVVQNVTDNIDRISLEQLSLGCNRDFHPLHRALGQMMGVLDALVQSANNILKLFRCQMVVPIYTEITYDAVCTYSISGFAWIFSCLLILSAMGHILIMFRSSYQNTVFDTKKHLLLDDSSGLIHSRTTPQTKKAKGKGRNEERWNDENEER